MPARGNPWRFEEVEGGNWRRVQENAEELRCCGSSPTDARDLRLIVLSRGCKDRPLPFGEMFLSPEKSSMRQHVVALCLAIIVGTTVAMAAEPGGQPTNVQLGPRPFFLVNDMADGDLKSRLQQCTAGPYRPSEFSIGHRGAPLQFPEHTRESYEAGARMGAGVLECDVAFTKDLELVCRHAQDDLHTTTNILTTPLARACTKPFSPAVFGPNQELVKPASAECRTSDITLAEFKSAARQDGQF